GAAAGAVLALYLSGEIETKLKQGQDRLGGALSESIAAVAQEAFVAKNDFLLVSVIGRTAHLPYVRSAWVADGAGLVAAHSESNRVGEKLDAGVADKLRGSTGVTAW